MSLPVPLSIVGATIAKRKEDVKQVFYGVAVHPVSM
jgi:hypothetical protein